MSEKRTAKKSITVWGVLLIVLGVGLALVWLCSMCSIHFSGPHELELRFGRVVCRNHSPESMSDTSFSIRIRNKATFGARARGICLLTIAGLLGAAVSGCDTPYTKRVRQLDDAYQTGDLPREDYMRFAHEEEQWDQVHTSNSFWSK